jgi:hypothetical protein
LRDSDSFFENGIESEREQNKSSTVSNSERRASAWKNPSNPMWTLVEGRNRLPTGEDHDGSGN